MQKNIYVRQGHIIRMASNGNVFEDCKTINKAKKRSRKLQGTKLGQGRVRRG